MGKALRHTAESDRMGKKRKKEKASYSLRSIFPGICFILFVELLIYRGNCLTKPTFEQRMGLAMTAFNLDGSGNEKHAVFGNCSATLLG